MVPVLWPFFFFYVVDAFTFASFILPWEYVDTLYMW